ncbi:MAG: pyrroline-5-carboxylate reductase [Deltaproteobacteria bacterium]|nr:pyrroline-5-carboxylate reductase [Deltaproteobacteria bacterium]MBF0527066.1 pyrroline-5-carboxylate reductase [Deltaproteobacteria bacterium]
MSRKIGFIGAGNMGGALIKGLVTSRKVTPDQITAADASESRLKSLSQEFGIVTTTDNLALAQTSEVIVLAVKPGVVKPVLLDIRAEIPKGKLVISVAAGITIDFISSFLDMGVRIIRAMPNTPALIQAGAVGLSIGPKVPPEDVDLAKMLFGSIGLTVVVGESMMDAVTGLSGSGPGYVFLIIEALTDAGVKMGLNRADAQVLACQTLYGSAKLMLETGEHPAKLKDMVTSPGGTTMAGLHELEKSGIRGTIISAVEAATLRSRELSRG